MKRRKDKKGRILHTGETQRPDGRYCYRYTDASGARKCFYADDLPELRKLEDLMVKDRVDGIEPDKHLTLNDLFEKYLATRSFKASTEGNYKGLWSTHVSHKLGQAKVVDIHTSDVKVFCTDMTKQGYARSTIQIILGMIRPALELAVEDNIIRHNPAKGISSKDYGSDPVERKALTAEQQAKLLEFVRDTGMYSKHYPMLIILLGTGLRASEAIALTWGDVDMTGREIRITKQLVYKDYGDGDGYRFHLTTPKTKAGIRTIPMTQEVYDAFCMQKEVNFQRGVQRDVECEGLKGFVFTAVDGGPMMPGSLNSILYHIVDGYNKREARRGQAQLRPYTPDYIPRFSAHVLRHTACTRMLEASVPVKATSYILGHADCGVTLSVYDHITDIDQVRDALENMKVDHGTEVDSEEFTARKKSHGA